MHYVVYNMSGVIYIHTHMELYMYYPAYDVIMRYMYNGIMAYMAVLCMIYVLYIYIYILYVSLAVCHALLVAHNLPHL